MIQNIITFLGITCLSIYLVIFFLRRKHFYQIETLKEIRKLHKDAIVEYVDYNKDGITVTAIGTAVYINNGSIQLFEFSLKWVNKILISTGEELILPYNKNSLKHEFTAPTKKNHWREDQLEQYRKKNA